MSFRALQIDLAERCNADSWFADITVLHERMGNLSYRIQQALGNLTPKNGKVGTFVVIGAAEGNVPSAEAQGPQFRGSRLNVTVFENVLVNTGSKGTNKAALDTAVRICQLLHQYLANGLGGEVTVAREAIRPDKPPVEGVIAYRIPLVVDIDSDRDPKVDIPAIAVASGALPKTVTISCGTSGAAIYYTLDDSHPWSGNDEAVLYTVPFSVSAACAVRAIAYKANMIASDSALAVIS